MPPVRPGSVPVLAGSGGTGRTSFRKTTVATANTALWVERQNVKAAKAYAETIKVALDAKTREAEALRAECERLKAQQVKKQ